MGNVCSSGFKKKKESLSEKSDESPSYRLTLKRENSSCKEYLNSEVNSGHVKYNTKEPTESKTSVITENYFHEIDNTLLNGSPISSPQITSAPSEMCAERALPSHLKILHGKEAHNNETERYKKIVIYVLSNNNSEDIYYKDIIYQLFDKIENMCQITGFELIITDLNDNAENMETYKIVNSNHCEQNTFQAKSAHEAFTNGLSEISRHISSSYVLPVLLMGSSLGTPRLPLTIESHDFKSLLNKGSFDDSKLLEMWYTTDKSCERACYRLKTDNSDTNFEEKENELFNLVNVLIKLFSDDLKDSYMSTVLEQEIYNSILKSQEIAKRCIWIQIGEQSTKTSDSQSCLEIEKVRRFENITSKLKKHLSEKNISRILFSTNIIDEEFPIILQNFLERLIKEVFDEHLLTYSIPSNTNGVSIQLLREVRLVNTYSITLAKNKTNEDIMVQIKRYIESNSEYPLVITGHSDVGKRVLVSKLVEKICTWNTDIHVIVRYGNLSEASSDITSLLGSIANQLSVLINGSQCQKKHTLSNYAKIIKNLMDTTKLSIVLIIDSVDKVLNGNSFDWLPIKIKPASKVILTVTDFENGESSSTIKKFLDNGIPNENIIQFKYQFESELNDAICSGEGSLCVPNGDFRLFKILNRNPIFHAKTLCWLAWLRCFSVDNTDISEVFEKVFLTIESTFSSEDIAFMLLTISLTNWGMRESDCIGILRHYSQLDVPKSFRIWSKFCWIMGPMLLSLNNIRIADNIFRDAILRRYQYKQKFVHESIRDYYEKQPNTYASSKGISKPYNLQKLLKLPYHYLCALEETSNAKKSEKFLNSYFFTDLHWANRKIIATGSIPFLYDIIMAKHVLANCGISYLHIDVLEKFLEKYFNELNYDGRQFLTLFKYFLKEKKDDALYKFNEVIMAWHSFIDQAKSTYLEIISDQFQDQTCKSCGGYNMLVYLPQKELHVATLSTEREEICIWDIKKCERVREFKGIPQPTAIYPVGSADAAVLCKREIKVINLVEGNFKVTLKGVMNQKMPYFGQHDEKHLVCLSRNRMYVNLMNLESGDCVTTFKAGEDRFLNSLLVSGDGRILVCGDETQKPFPLLVWHLSQRKLLYDLRIPHHDFITSLSAITYEGGYVCVVAKEINEPTPNFIVVYDLQSGTLFKKWKPVCNTVSLAISQSNASVISGLENANILIWDLVTGNCRSTLIGHNAPVSFLKLDPLGNVLLSRDNESRDDSIRLWEIATGKFLAVYTPPTRITNCEILANGNFVVLTLQDFTNILTLTLKNYSEVLNDNLK